MPNWRDSQTYTATLIPFAKAISFPQLSPSQPIYFGKDKNRMRVLDHRRQQHNFQTLNIVCGYFVRRIQTRQRRQRGHPWALLYYLYIMWIIIITAWICIRPTIHICNMLSIIVDITTYHRIQYSIAHRTWILECIKIPSVGVVGDGATMPRMG